MLKSFNVYDGVGAPDGQQFDPNITHRHRTDGRCVPLLKNQCLRGLHTRAVVFARGLPTSSQSNDFAKRGLGGNVGGKIKHSEATRGHGGRGRKIYDKCYHTSAFPCWARRGINEFHDSVGNCKTFVARFVEMLAAVNSFGEVVTKNTFRDTRSSSLARIQAQHSLLHVIFEMKEMVQEGELYKYNMYKREELPKMVNALITRPLQNLTTTRDTHDILNGDLFT
ncbi:hypothetical protein BJ508DRAFT_301952 [Ascobolus immersus RN42]|uniref:Uncharacterized protein n=1 Tax=Ascobolus immersus RN42 TaxID=1160509 RepID=A0A3N4IQT9_ASCIM|nr:hypothetical protein BJ508DRAFT_301952 [Ascobolus immersus RN42]